MIDIVSVSHPFIVSSSFRIPYFNWSCSNDSILWFNSSTQTLNLFMPYNLLERNADNWNFIIIVSFKEAFFLLLNWIFNFWIMIWSGSFLLYIIETESLNGLKNFIENDFDNNNKKTSNWTERRSMENCKDCDGGCSNGPVRGRQKSYFEMKRPVNQFEKTKNKSDQRELEYLQVWTVAFVWRKKNA